MKVFITNLPSFYKINLYNGIAEREQIFVLYTGTKGDDRNPDFFQGKMAFRHLFLQGTTWRKIAKILRVLKCTDYSELIIGGWDTPMMWAAAYFSPKGKNSVVVESSYHESCSTGIKALIKKMFLNRISKAYVPGISNEVLLQKLNFKGHIVMTKGVGVFNYVSQPPFIPRTEVKKFLFVGRLVEVKNLKLLIRVFNGLPQFTLSIIGFGEQENELKAMAKENVKFLGAVDNKCLPDIYQSHDVFILPSKSEPWGLVVEEALNNGIPVLVSDRVGCAEEIVNESNGLVFHYNEMDSLRNAVLQMTDIAFYNQLRKNISRLDFAKIESEQIDCYL